MVENPVKHCPECLSTLEGPVANCPHCGAVLVEIPRRRQIWPILVFLAASVVVAYLAFRDPTPGPNKPTDPPLGNDPAISPETPKSPSPLPSPRRENDSLSAFWVLRAEHQPEIGRRSTEIYRKAAGNLPKSAKSRPGICHGDFQRIAAGA